MKKKPNPKTQKKKISEQEGFLTENVLDLSLEKLASVTTENSYLSFSGTKPNQPVTGNIVFDRTSTIKNLGSPVNDTDAATASEVTNIVARQKSLFLKKIDDCVLPGFSMSGHTILSYKTANQDSEPITLKQINETLSNYISITNDNLEEIITGNLIFNGNSVIKNFKKPIEDGDLVSVSNLNEQLQETSLKIVKKDRFDLQGRLDLKNHSITEIGNPIEDSDGVSLGFFKNQKQKFPTVDKTTNQKFHGDLTCDKQSLIKNIPEYQDLSDALNMQECISMIRESQKEFLKQTGGETHGSFDLNQHVILNLGNPVQNDDLLNISVLSSITSPYISYQGNNISRPITGDIILNNQKIKNIQESSHDNDAISYGEIKTIIDSNNSAYLLKNDTALETSFRISGNRLLNLGDATEESSAINVKVLKEVINHSLKNLIKPSGNNSMEGSINASGFSIIGLSDATEEHDGVNLNTLQITTEAYKNDFIPTTGGTLSGNLNLSTKKITNLRNPSNPQDPVTVAFLKQAFTDQIALNTSNKANPHQKNLIFNGEFNLKGLSEPKNEEDAVTLGYLSKRTENMIPLKGNSEDKPLKNIKFAKGFGIKNLGDCTHDSEILNLRSLNKHVSEFASSFLGTTGNISISGALDMNGYGIFGLNSPENEEDLINLSDLQRQTSDLMNFKGTTVTLKGDLIFDNGRMFLMSNPATQDEPFNKKFLENSLKNYVKKSSSLSNPIKVDIDLQQQYTVIQSEEALASGEAVTLRTALDILEQHTAPFLKKNGGILKETLYLSQIKNVKATENPNDPVKLEDILKQVESKVLLSENKEETKISGNLIFNSPGKIEGIPNPQSPLDMVNLKTCQSLLDNYVKTSLTGTPIKIGGFDGNFKYIPTGIANPLKPYDAMNFITLKAQIARMQNSYVFRNQKSDMKGVLNLKDNRITGIAAPAKPQDGVNLKYLNEYLSQFPDFNSDYEADCNINCSNIFTIKNFNESSHPTGALSLRNLNKIKEEFVSLSHDGDTIEMEGNIICTPKSSCNGLRMAEDPSEVVSLEQLRNIFYSGSLIPLSGGKIEGDLLFEDSLIKNIGNSTRLDAAVNLFSLNQKKKSHLSLSGNTNSTPLTVPLVFNEKTTLEDLVETTEDNDLANLNNLNNEIENLKALFVTENNLVVDGDLNMQGNIIRGIKDPIIDEDGLNLRTLKQFLENFLPEKSEVPVTLSGNLYLDPNARIFLKKNPVKESDAVNGEYLLKLIALRKSELISLSEKSILNGNLKLEGVINNLGDPEQDSDAVHIAFAEHIIKNDTEDLISDFGGHLNGNLVVNGTLTGISSPEAADDAVNIKNLTEGLETLKTLLLPNSGGSLNGSLSASLITGIPEATKDQHPVTFTTAFKKTQEAYQNLLSLQNTESTGDLRIGGHKITNLAPPEQSSDAVNFGEMISRLQNKLPLQNRNSLHRIVSVWNLNDHMIAKHCDPSNALDGLNLKTLKQQLAILTSPLLPINGGTIPGALNLNGHKIKNSANSSGTTDGVSLKNLNNYLSQFLKIKSESPIIVKSHIMGNGHTISMATAPEEDNDLTNRAALQQIIHSKNNEMALKNSEIKMQGDLSTQTIINLGDPISDGDAVNRSYLEKSLQKASSFFLPLDTSVPMKTPVNMNLKEIVNVSPNNAESSGVNLTTVSEKLQDYLSEKGGTFSNTLTITGKISGLPEPKAENDLVNLGFAVKSINQACVNLVSSTEAEEIDYDLNFVGKGQIKGVGYPQEYGDATTISFWNSCLNKPYTNQGFDNIDNTLIVPANTYIEWKESTTGSSSVYSTTEKEKLLITKSGLYHLDMVISVADIIFGESFDKVMSFELQLKSSNGLKILEKSYTSSHSTFCISSSFEVDIQNSSDNYYLSLFSASYHCEIHEIFWSCIKLSELSVSEQENK